jgi:SAM-dependent methyltransferase
MNATSTGFKDHFSNLAESYARYRPSYPPELFSYLSAQAPDRECAWDCATGTGQAAVALGAHFDRVIATDASATQVRGGEPHPRVEYRVAPAEASGLADRSVDLVTVAQAVHWFDLPRFSAEADRVLRPRGLLAIWCYGHVQLNDPAAQRLVEHYYSETVGPYWPPERRMVEDGYRGMTLPFPEERTPEFVVRRSLNLEQLIGYLGTWSATRRCAEFTGVNPLPELSRAVAAVWGSPEEPREVRWPLSVRVCRKPN